MSRHIRVVTAVIVVLVVGCRETTDVEKFECPEEKATTAAHEQEPGQGKAPDSETSDEPQAPVKLEYREGEPIPLTAPDREGGMPLMAAIDQRHSTRKYQETMLSMEQLSSLLYAAHGVSRPETLKRTTPTARNWQNMEVYVTTAAGLFVYDAPAHELQPVLPDDIRVTTGKQPFVATAPINLVYVADYDKMGKDTDDAQKRCYSGTHAGFIGQNVYLYCASAGLATVVRAHFDEEELRAAMKLPDNKHIVLAQTIGFPAAQPVAE